MLLSLTGALAASGCASTATSFAPSSAAIVSASASPLGPSSAPGNPYGRFTFSGWLDAANVGPVQPLPFATPVGAVPNTPPTVDGAGQAVTGSASGTQCFHASSRTDIDQYEALLVFVIRGQRYLLSLGLGFERPGQNFGEATPPAGGRLGDFGGNIDQLRFDAEGVRLSADPMFLGSYSDGVVVLAPNLRSGSIDVTLQAHGSAASSPLLHVTGSFVCP